MAEQDLRFLKRKDLVDLLYESEKNNEALKQQLQEAEDKNKELADALEQRTLQVTEAGNLADAVLKINGVYEAAQAAAEDYLTNIRTISEKEDQICAERDAKSKKEAEQLLEDTTRRCDEMLSKTKEDCRTMEEQTKENCEAIKQRARAEVEQYWKELTQHLEEIYEANQGMKEVLSAYDMQIPAEG